MLIALILVIIFLFAIEVPQDIQKGLNGQIAIEELNGMRHPLINIKAVTSRFHNDEDASTARTELEKLSGSAETCIIHYEHASDYNDTLSENVTDFTLAFNRWLDAEKKYINQFSKTQSHVLDHSEDHSLIVKASENNALFLNAMQLLADGEIPIYEDIEKGRRAFHTLEWAASLLIIYFFILALLFQRNSKRGHAAREKNLEVILQSIGDAVIATDIHGNITRMNPEAERLTGWDNATAYGSPLSQVFKVVDENSGQPIEDLVERVKRENSIVVQIEDSMLIAANGNRYQIFENGAPIHDDSGSIIGVVLVFKDITHAHYLKSRLNEGNQRLQRVVDTSMDAVIVTNEQGMVKEWNPAAESIFGWSKDEITNLPIHETIIPEEFRDRHLQGIERLISSTNQSSVQAKRIESTALHKKGHTFPIELAMTSLRTENGWIFNAFIRDLSEQKENEHKLQQHDVLLRKAAHVAKLGYWELDFKNDSLKWSDEIFQIFALNPKTTKASYDLFINTIHPEDREHVDTAFSDSLKYKTPYNITHRIVTSDGEKIVHELCETTFDNNGNPVRSLGLIQDITERINNVDELRLAAATFKTHAGILVTDTKGTIIRVNPAFEEMTGYSSEELVGQNPRILQSGRQDTNFYKNMWNTLTNNGMWQGELWNKRKDGSPYVEWLTLTAVKNETGEVTHYVGTSQDITKRKQAESQIEHLAYHDDLTGLANRRLLLDRLHQNIAACKRYNKHGAVLLLDLDRFKDLNDSLGHPVGDQILRQVASRLTTLLREEDTIARLGGDEFVVVLSSVDDEDSKIGIRVQAIAEKIRMALSKPYTHKGGQCYSNVSIGITLFPEISNDIDDILKHADTALYRAKAQGRNTVCFYQPSMQIEVDEKLAIANGLRDAIKNNELVLHYQPQVNERGELFGAEALIRWQHPEKGMIPPDQFIPIAEDTGLILDVGQWVLQEAVKQVSEWNTAGICQHEMLRLAINVSPRQFRQHDFVEQILRVFKQANVSPNCIELEVTESVLMDNLDEVVEKMETLRAHGIRISIDDFGTGYSSLSYLKQLPIDVLKIDQSFVRDITNNDSDAMVVETIISMAHHLGLSVIAEGVENQQELDFLLDKGCKTFQGYYFSRPVNAEDFARYVTDRRASYLPNRAS